MMSEAQKDNDQNMDDILASIRKIISDDGAPSSNSDGGNGGVASVIDQVPLQTSDRGNDPARGDDLSDIFEQPAETGSAVGNDAPTPRVSANAATERPGEWSFDNSDKRLPASSGSLTDKLASLGNATSTVAAPETKPKAEPAQDIPTAAPSTPAPSVVEAPAAGNEEVSLEDALETVRKAAAMEEAAESPSPQNAASPNAVSEATPNDRAADAASEAPIPKAVVGVPVAPSDVESTSGQTAVSRTSEPTATTQTSSDTKVATMASGKPLEALVTEALKPMLQEWLDANLERLVEEKLQEELKHRVK